jgi:hypothetical protein
MFFHTAFAGLELDLDNPKTLQFRKQRWEEKNEGNSSSLKLTRITFKAAFRNEPI